MNLNVIDEETLQVSDDVHYEVTMLDTHHVIVVDNVLKNPQLFLNLAVMKSLFSPILNKKFFVSF